MRFLKSLLAIVFVGALAPVVSWGIVPNSAERTPEAPRGGAELLARYDGMYVNSADADAGEKKVYLTFDLGYEAGYTDEVLDILKENGIKAIFFLCGNYLKNEELVGRMIAEGHEIGNHTNRHKDLPKLSEEGFCADIDEFSEKFGAKYGEAYKRSIKYFRPPQGRIDERVLKAVSGRGMKTVMWSVAIVDWGKTVIDAQASSDKIVKRIHPGAIVLSHITNSGTVEMLRMLLPKLSEKGYKIGDATQL